MRWSSWAFILVILLLVNSAVASDLGCTTCNGADGASYRALRGGACFCPPGFGTQPGCCVCPPSACDNAWDGYCDHKAIWQAFFYRVGTPKAHGCGDCCLTPVPAPCHCTTEVPQAVEPQPAPADKPTAPTTPAPAVPEPNKAAWKWSRPWTR